MKNFGLVFIKFNPTNDENDDLHHVTFVRIIVGKVE